MGELIKFNAKPKGTKDNSVMSDSKSEREVASLKELEVVLIEFVTYLLSSPTAVLKDKPKLRVLENIDE